MRRGSAVRPASSCRRRPSPARRSSRPSPCSRGGTVAAAILAAVFLNARYVAISMTVSSIFPGGKLRRLVESQAIVDESWALSGRRGSFEWPILVGSGLLFYVLWVAEHGRRDVRRRRARRSECARARRCVRGLVPRARPSIPARAARARGRCARGRDRPRAHSPFAPAGVPIIAAAAACLLGLRR